MKIALANAVKWLVTSSADSTQVSLTIKGLLLGAIPTILVLSGAAHLNLDQSTLTDAFDGIATVVEAVLSAISIAITTYGALRKVYLEMFPASTVAAIATSRFVSTPVVPQDQRTS